MPQVRWELDAVEEFAEIARLHRADAKRILVVLRRFETDGIGDTKKLSGRWDGKWRLRSGDWRIIFVWEGETMVVVTIANRRDAYE